VEYYICHQDEVGFNQPHPFVEFSTQAHSYCRLISWQTILFINPNPDAYVAESR